jgi:hypothetical protein
MLDDEGRAKRLLPAKRAKWGRPQPRAQEGGRIIATKLPTAAPAAVSDTAGNFDTEDEDDEPLISRCAATIRRKSRLKILDTK